MLVILLPRYGNQHDMYAKTDGLVMFIVIYCGYSYAYNLNNDIIYIIWDLINLIKNVYMQST